MKKIFFAFLILGSTATTVVAQNYRNQPPPTVRDQFNRDNPDRKANWRRDNNDWRASYRDNNNRNVEAYYGRDGRMRATHTTWSRREIPSEVDNRIYRMYRTRNYRATRIDRPNEQPLFQISLNFGGRNRVVYMDEQGRNRPYRR